MTKTPFISVITVSYNAMKTIEQTVLSVVNQTYENIEYIIIDGGSSDGTVDIIKRYENKIVYWISEPDKGIYDAMNKGVEVARGEYLFFLGADDLLVKDAFQKIFRNFKERPTLIYGNIRYDNEQKNIVRSKFSFKTYLHNTIHHQGALYRRSLFNDFRYSLFFKIASDYELNLKILLSSAKKNIIYKNIIISICSDDGISRENSLLAQKEMISIRKKYFNRIENFFLDLFAYTKFFVHSLIK